MEGDREPRWLRGGHAFGKQIRGGKSNKASLESRRETERDR